LHPSSFSVQQTARRLGLTRGRVYETLADVETILAVRWPEGPAFAAALAVELEARSADREAMALADSASQIFFPLGRSFRPRCRSSVGAVSPAAGCAVSSAAGCAVSPAAGDGIALPSSILSAEYAGCR